MRCLLNSLLLFRALSGTHAWGRGNARKDHLQMAPEEADADPLLHYAATRNMVKTKGDRAQSQHVALRKGMRKNKSMSSLETDRLVEFVAQRQLQEPVTVSEFCNDLSMVEDFLTTQYTALFEGEDSQAPFLLTETGSYICSCQHHEEGGGFTMKCALLLTFEEMAVLTTAPADSNFELVEFVPNQDGSGFVPSLMKWCNSHVDYRYCETIYPNLENPTQIDSCSAEDSGCNQTISCEVCPNGITVAFFDTCFSTEPPNCDGGYVGPFLYDAAWLEPLLSIVPDPPTTESCSSDDDIPSIEEYCQNLTAIETNFTGAHAKYLEPIGFSLLNDGFKCSCLLDDSSNATTTVTEINSTTLAPVFSVKCSAPYVSADDTNNVRLDIAIMEFSPSLTNPNILLPSRMIWNDTTSTEEFEDFYDETYELGLGQETLFACDIGGCETGFCGLCSDGLTVTHNCFAAAASCDTFVSGVFFLPLRHTKVAIEKCSKLDIPVDASSALDASSVASAMEEP